MNTADSFSALILAGGRGRRMGGVDKGLMRVAGRRLIEYALEALRGRSSEIFISANRNQEIYAAYGYPVLSDALGEYWGPLAGMLSGLKAASGEWLLVVACDYPLLPEHLGARLLRAALQNAAGVAVVRSGDQAHYTLCMLHTSLADDMERYLLGGGRSVRGWLEGKTPAWLEFEPADERLANLNSEADLASFPRFRR